MNTQSNYGLSCKAALPYKKANPAVVDIFMTIKSHRMAFGSSPSKIEVSPEFGDRFEKETGCKIPLTIDGTLIAYSENTAMLNLYLFLIGKIYQGLDK